MTNVVEEYYEDDLKTEIVDEIYGEHGKIKISFKEDADEREISDYIKKLPSDFIILSLSKPSEWYVLEIEHRTKWSKVLEIAEHIDDTPKGDVWVYMENGSWNAIKEMIKRMGREPTSIFPGSYNEEDEGEELSIIFVFPKN